jgi:predicted 3-demethylubiquinone-9 3-methyltransferase (glyoxalase superfamily)
MQKFSAFLCFKDQAEEAVSFCTSVFKDSKVLRTMPGHDGT